MAVSKKDRPDEAKAGELWDLSCAPGEMHWGRELKKCPNLLGLVPSTRTGRRIRDDLRPTVLHIAMERVLKRAYDDYRSNDQRRVVPAAESLAGAAVVGVLTADPETYKNKAPGTELPPRLVYRTDRINIALDWYHTERTLEVFRRPHHINKCLESFRDALIDVLQDEEVLESIVFQLESEGKLKRALPQAPPYPLGVQSLGQTFHGQYIPRPAPEAEIMGHLDQSDTSIVYTHGDAGTGKTRLAETCAARYAKGERVPVINAADDEQLYEDLKGVVVASGHALDDELNRYNVESKAADLFRSDGWPHVVIFDNVTDFNRLAFLPVPSKAKILLTGIEQPPPGYAHAQIRISNMDVDEARAMVLDRWPSCPESDLPSLLQALGNKPLAIEHACAYLRDTGSKVEAFLAALDRKAAEFADMMGYPHDRTLTAIYSMLLTRLGRHEGALWALDIIVHTYSNKLDIRGLAFIWPDEEIVALCGDDAKGHETSPKVLPTRQPGITFSIDHSPGEVQPSWVEATRAALRILERLNLIEITDGRILMHNLTWAILRDLRSDRRDMVLARIGKIGSVVITGGFWLPSCPLSKGSLYWFDYLKLLIEGVSPAELKSIMLKANDAALISQLMLYSCLLRMGKQRGESLPQILEGADVVYQVAIERLTSQQDTPSLGLLQALRYMGLELIDWWIRCSESSAAVNTGLTHHRNLVDTFESKGKDPWPLPPYWHMLAEHDSEWGVLHLLISDDTLEGERDRLFDSPDWTDFWWPVKSGAYAMHAGLIYTYQARWNDAIAALEHAFSSFFKLAGLPYYSYGAAESARRLAQAYLRMGRLEDAKGWAARAEHVAFNRFEVEMGDYAPARLHDTNWSVKLQNTKFEIEFTENVNTDAQSFFDSDYRQQRLPRLTLEFYDMLEIICRTQERKLGISVMVNLLRAAYAQPGFPIDLDKGFVGKAFNDIRVQAEQSGDLIDDARFNYTALTRSICKAPSLVINLHATGDPDEFYRQVSAAHDIPGFTLAHLARAQFAVAHRFGKIYCMPYWEMRALLHALFLGWLGNADAKWLWRVERRFVSVAEKIGRTDLIDRLAHFTETLEPPFWMLGL